VREYVCKEAIPLSRQVVLEFVAPENMALFQEGEERRAKLALMFLSAYNYMSFRICDQPNFRTLHSTRVALPSENEPTFDSKESYLIVNIEGSCRNCTKDLPLFGSQTTHTNDPGVSHSKVGIASEGSEIARCICPASTRNEPITAENFLQNLNAELTSIDGPTFNISFANVMELKEVPRSSGVMQFTSFAHMDVHINDFPSAQEMLVLENAFSKFTTVFHLALVIPTSA
jgi:hypothetical protein